MPVMIALARMYRGEHHPTDILGSLLFAALWLTATTMLIRPAQGGLDRRETGSANRVMAAADPVSASAREQQRTG